MNFVLMFDVMLILSILCLFVLPRLARGYEDLKNHPGTWNLKSQASCALDHFYLPNNVLYNYFMMHWLNFLGPNRSP
jgi:competence protein ComGC